jgi:hypothetical protein
MLQAEIPIIALSNGAKGLEPQPSVLPVSRVIQAQNSAVSNAVLRKGPASRART